MRLARPAALAVTLCACESSAPASSRKVPPPLVPVASDWTGMHVWPPPVASAASADATKGTWVLHVGDSFVGASFAQNLEPRFQAAGTRQVAFAKTATYTTTWAYDPDVDQWLARRPALVLVTLGANEVDNLIPQLHAGAIHALARKVGAVAPCVWIAPPLWKEDATGWLQVIHDHCAPCLFFDSDALLGGGLKDDERRRDRIHPNERGGARWAESFWGWLEDHRRPEQGGWALAAYEQR
jgi:lysophospholipase L1-like esterase